MDRRSWLWRRKSSEKSPGEAESSGSMSSHSDRFSDDQAYSSHLTQSPEVTSKGATSDGEVNDSVKTLKDKLSAALLTISAKEDLVKQHAKVAEEAVSGWEKAEREVFTLKQQLEAATQRNSALEDRVGHLDGALKECLRQLRQAREEQEQKTREAVAEKTREWESTKSELESHLVELQSQLQVSRTEASISVDANLNPRLEAAEKENSALKLELLSRAEELQHRTIERDLSTLAAETASKQHLESIKKVAKLEAECRRLKAVARKASPGNDYRSFTASSVFVESFTDSQSDSGERQLVVVETDTRKMGGMEPNECEPSHSDSWASALIAELDQFKNEKAPGRTLMAPSIEINLMDDFLEMERLAALPETESGSCCAESGASLDQSSGGVGPLKADLEAMINRTAELEEKLEKMEVEKVELDMALHECQNQLNTSRNQLKEAEMELVELQTQLATANEARRATAGELEASDSKREVAESRLIVAEADIKALLLKVGSLDKEVQRERDLSGKSVSKCQKLEEEILRMKREVELRNAASSSEMLKIKQDDELAVAASKFAECQKTIAALGQQLKALATLEDFLSDSDKSSELPIEGSQFPEDGAESQKLDSSDLYTLQRDVEASKLINGNSGPLKNSRDGDSLFLGSPAIITSEKNQNGCREFLPRIKSGS
ncbi:filament-like plant protein [Cornus florida]|uniref:filament-like plant protein n=1 Tax=Cornus florida TaxID=4283 RepID=UPI00289D1F0A|nr:filament-like plant protein [Cornus florida]XP_059656338.1 filament-like plant protein [Cornus florida]XP_059656339.1 filament-like plant protein [Cornus florida]